MPIFSPIDIAKENVEAVQDYSLLAGRSLANIFGHPRYFADTLLQADSIGVGSLPIVVLTGFFTGAVLALQTSSTLQQFGSLSLTGKLVSLSMVRELGPVLTGLMVAGRNSSGMASELGSMKVTEQIDAMRAMGVDPSKKLVTPRVIASVVMLFFLSIISDLVGLTGGFVISYLLLGLDPNQYWTTAYQALRFGDVFMGLMQTRDLRLYHLQHRLLLRPVCQGRHARRGTRYHASGGCRVGAHPGQRFFHYPAADGDFPVLICRASHRRRSSANRQPRPRLIPSFASTTLKLLSITRCWRVFPFNCPMVKPRS